MLATRHAVANVTVEQANGNVVEMQAAIQDMEDRRVDSVFPQHGLRAVLTDKGGWSPDDNDAALYDRVGFQVGTQGGEVNLRVLKGAHDQIAYRLKIPRAYYSEMLQHVPELLAFNINGWIDYQGHDVKRLVRMMKPNGDADLHGRLGTQLDVRAFLSNRYRPLNHSNVMKHALPAFLQAGAMLTEWSLDDQKFRARAVLPGRSLQEIAVAVAAQNGISPAQAMQHYEADGKDVSWVGEQLQFGVAVGNSETGHGALSVEPYALICRCINGIIVTEKVNIRHVGRRLEDDSYLSNEAKDMDDGATFLKVRDLVRFAFQEETQRTTGMKMIDAAGTPLALPATRPLMEFTTDFGKAVGMNEAQQAILQKEMQDELLVTGLRVDEATKWTLSQAITATARQVDDFDAKEALQRAGFKVLGDTPSALIAAATKAAK